jgi:small-conductance mechanosensitive channel
LPLTLPLVPLEGEGKAAIGHWLIVAFILLLGWSCTAAITLASDFYLRRTDIDFSGDPLGRKHLTQVRVLRRVAATLVIVVTVAAALMTFESVKQYGVSLIASAGAAGLVVGLAARPLLTNLFAGIQIALTQPIRIGDAVIVEGEWGWIEEITGTYVVIKIWDWRRMVVPLSYFLEKPFQNWTRQTTDLIGSVMLWVDYTVPVTPHSREARRARESLEAVGRPGREPAGRRQQRACPSAALPRERADLARGLGPALRDAGKADRLPSGRISGRAAQAEGGTGRIRPDDGTRGGLTFSGRESPRRLK